MPWDACQALQKLGGRTRQHLEGARKLLSLASSDLDRISGEGGASLGDCVPGFDPNLNRDILGPTPPRPVSLMTLGDSLAYLSRFLQDLNGVCDIVKVWGKIARSSNGRQHCLRATTINILRIQKNMEAVQPPKEAIAL